MKNQYGFTLIEVLGLIVLIAIISAIAYPAVSVMLKDSNTKRYENYQNTVKQAAQLYVERNRNLFPTLENVGGTTTVTCATLNSNNYLQADLKNPKTNKNSTACSVQVKVGSDKILIYNYLEG